MVDVQCTWATCQQVEASNQRVYPCVPPTGCYAFIVCYLPGVPVNRKTWDVKSVSTIISLCLFICCKHVILSNVVMCILLFITHELMNIKYTYISRFMSEQPCIIDSNIRNSPVSDSNFCGIQKGLLTIYERVLLNEQFGGMCYAVGTACWLVGCWVKSAGCWLADSALLATAAVVGAADLVHLKGYMFTLAWQKLYIFTGLLLPYQRFGQKIFFGPWPYLLCYCYGQTRSTCTST